MARRTKRRWWWFTPPAASGVTLWILNTWPPSDPIWRYLAYCLLIPAAWIVAASYFVAGTQWWRHLAKAVRIATALTCCVLVVLLLALVYRFRPRPPADLLKARAFAYKKHHIPGSQDSGITWYDAKATDLRVTVSNDTDNGYQDFDLIIDPDAWIVGVAEL